MERIYKLPLILGFLAALAAGIAGYALGMRNSEIYIRMAVMMVAFFVLGLYIRNSILSVKKEVKEKLIDDAIKGMEEFRKQREQELAKSQMNSRTSQSDLGQKPQDGLKEGTAGNVEDEDDDFKPLNVSKAIKTKILE